MIKTSHPINAKIIIDSLFPSENKLLFLEPIFNEYNNHYLPQVEKQISPMVKELFLEGYEQISASDTTFKGLEQLDDTMIFNISSIQYQKNTYVEGNILFTNVQDFLAEFDSSPITFDYLMEILPTVLVYDIYLDYNHNNQHIIDIYALEGHTDIDNIDEEDVALLHIQFKFDALSSDLTPTKALEEN